MARRSRTGWVALGISLALHVLVVLLASSRLPQLPRAPQRRPLEVQVVHLPPAAPPPAPPPPAPAPQVPSPTRKRKPSPRQEQAASPAAPRTPEKEKEQEGEQGRAGARPPVSQPPADAPLAGRGSLLLPRNPPPLPDDGVKVVGEGGGLRARESRGEVAGILLRESMGRQNVARGSVHAYFGKLRDVLEQVWDVRRVAREGRGKSRVGAQVRLTQGPGGELRVIELVFSSSDDDIDRGLIADLRAAARRLPAPPPEVVRGRAEFSSLWSFQFMARTKYRASGALATFDVVNLLDKKAIPPPLDKRVELLEAE